MPRIVTPKQFTTGSSRLFGYPPLTHKLPSESRIEPHIFCTLPQILDMAEPILISFELPDIEPLSQTLIESLAPLPVVLVGHYAVPEQTPSEDARREFGEDATAKLEQEAERFKQLDSPVETRLEFGKDRASTVDRIADEEDCTAELIATSTGELQRILVPIPPVAEFDRLPRFLKLFSGDTTDRITLFHVVEGEERITAGEEILREQREGLIDAEFDSERIETRLSEGSHDDEILDIAEDYDAVVMYSAESRLGDRIFGNLPNRISDRSENPVIVVRRDY